MTSEAQWRPGITSQAAWEQHLQDQATCACGHIGGAHGLLHDPVRIGHGACYTCACHKFTHTTVGDEDEFGTPPLPLGGHT